MAGGEKQRVGVIYGPTAIGKTALSLRIAEGCGAEIISADSLAVYRHMNIGTAKPTPEEQARVPHHLVDVVDPDAPFTAADFAREGRRVLEGLHRSGTPALVVGGTGLYIRALCRGLFEGPPASPALRAELRAEEAESPGAMHRRLAQVDEVAAARLHPRDLIRLERALEVFMSSGRTLTDWLAEHAAQESPFDLMEFGLTLPRPMLYERIEARVDAMFDAGLIGEIKSLMDRGYGPSLKPMGALGYLHGCRYLTGEISQDEARRTLKRDTRRYGKRQLTWMNSWATLKKVDARSGENIAAELSGFLKTP